MLKKLIFILLIFLATTNVDARDTPAGEKQAVILMYHHFGVDRHPSTNIKLDQFDEQIKFLSQNDYLVWPIAKVVHYIQNKKEFPGRVVAITIDDAYVSVYTEAFPRLRKQKWPFTVFVSTDGVDKRYKSYMTWSQMREMQQHGVTFANHSASHDYLVRRLRDETQEQWEIRVTNDIQRAQKRLKEELGNAPMLFAYPYGEYNAELSKIISDLGYIAFGQHSGPAGFSGDLLALPRFPIAEKSADLPGFKQKINSLAFPVLKQKPWDPTLSFTNNPPLLEISLGQSEARLNQLNCFAPDQGRIEIKWISRKQKIFSVQAKSPLPTGRSRYNCTAPSQQKGRYYWYSHLWINPLTGNQ